VSPLGAALEPYVTSLIRVRDGPRSRVPQTELRARAESLLVLTLALPLPIGDDALAYLLFLDNVGGEVTAERLSCRALERGKAIQPVIESYQRELPDIGFRRLPRAIFANGDLAASVLLRIRRNERCSPRDH
jgi:hypothetical protein